MPTPTNKPIEPVKAWAVLDNGKISLNHFFYDTQEDAKNYALPMGDKVFIEVLITPLTQSHAEEKKEFSTWTCPRCQKVHSQLSMQCDCPPNYINTYSGTNSQPMKILHSGTTVREGDKFTHVEWEVYENVCEILKKQTKARIEVSQKCDANANEIRSLQAQNERMRERFDVIHDILFGDRFNDIGEAVCEVERFFNVWGRPTAAPTSPPSESIKEGEREPSAEDALHWLAANCYELHQHVDDDSYYLSINVPYGKEPILFRADSPLACIRSAMKSESERNEENKRFI